MGGEEGGGGAPEPSVGNKEHEQEQTAQKMAGGTIKDKIEKSEVTEEGGAGGGLTRRDQIQVRNSRSTRSEPLFLMLIWRLGVGQV